MTTYDYLNQIRRNDAMINAKLEEIEQLRTVATKITVVTDAERVQSSGDKDKIGKIASKIVDMQRELEERIDTCYTDRSLIIRQMESLDTSEYQTLFYKFVSNMDMESIAERINYSNTQIYRIYKRAMKNFEARYGSNYLNL